MGRESVVLLWALLLVWSRECQSYTTAGYVYSATDSITDGEKETNISCDFDSSECGYSNASSDFQWIRHTGPTASVATGPSGDHTTGHGYYMYIETSNVLTRAVARLVSPTVSDSGQYCLQFAYHMYGADIDQLRVLVGSSVVWIRSNNQGNSWHQASVDVYIFYDQIVFEGFGGNGYRGDIAIDDVVLYPGSCQWTDCPSTYLTEEPTTPPDIDTYVWTMPSDYYHSFQIRLSGGNNYSYGRVEVYYNGEWGTVCDDSFDQHVAIVVCGELGFDQFGSHYYDNAHYGSGSGRIWMDDVDCTGFETSLQFCQHRGWGSHNCGHEKDASVFCSLQSNQSEPRTTERPRRWWWATTDGLKTVSDRKPCGDFPWDTDDVTVYCDYDWLDALENFWVRGYCNVSCPSGADMLTGPPYDDYTRNSAFLPHGSYYCDYRSWQGTEPVCLGQYNNATMVTDEPNGIRMVGGEFYGCVEMYDEVTQQWGPVRGRAMKWSDVACKTLGFHGVRATDGYRLSNGSIRDSIISLSSHYRPAYPSTSPKFLMIRGYDPPENGPVMLHDAIGLVERACVPGQCSLFEAYTFCLACAGERRRDIAQDIGVKVTCTSHLLLVSFPRTSSNGFSFQKEDVHFAAPPCSADENSTHIYIRAPLTDCGTRKRQDNRFIVTYSNTLTINLNASSAIKIDVECHLLSSKVVTVNFNQQSVYKSRVVGRGEFIVSMELYMSDSFWSPVSEYPLYVEFGQMLYAQLQVTSDDTNLQVFADHCWVTPTELNYGPYDSEEDYIIRGGCVRQSTVRYDSPSTMEERFGFQAFPPTRTTRKIYLQCEVLLCDVTNSSSRCAQGCIEDMYRWKRETEGDTEVYQLIRGPIVLVELNSNQTDREDVSRSHAVSKLSSFLGACAVMVVVAMLIVI